MSKQTPIAWLWSELAAILPTQDYLDLQIGYQEQQRRYNRASQVRTAKRDLALFERNSARYAPGTPQHTHYQQKIARRQATIARLEAELA